MAPNNVAEFLYLASKRGWSREALNAAPWFAVADWCREQGWDGFADQLQTDEHLRGYVKQVAEDESDYRFEWLNGSACVWNSVYVEWMRHFNKAARG